MGQRLGGLGGINDLLLTVLKKFQNNSKNKFDLSFFLFFASGFFAKNKHSLFLLAAPP